jgi:probable HAF family extracellular repeat protein
MRDLGIVPDMSLLTGTSAATGINAKTQIVGAAGACDGSANEAFLWEKGSMVNLNALIPSDSAMYLIWAVQINDRGEITGFGVLPNGDLHSFLLLPCDENSSERNCQGSDDGSVIARTQRPSVVVPENVRRLIRQRLGSRRHVPGLGTPKD